MGIDGGQGATRGCSEAPTGKPCALRWGSHGLDGLPLCITIAWWLSSRNVVVELKEKESPRDCSWIMI
jgi:hypothetical protein